MKVLALLTVLFVSNALGRVWYANEIDWPINDILSNDTNRESIYILIYLVNICLCLLVVVVVY